MPSLGGELDEVATYIRTVTRDKDTTPKEKVARSKLSLRELAKEIERARAINCIPH